MAWIAGLVVLVLLVGVVIAVFAIIATFVSWIVITGVGAVVGFVLGSAVSSGTGGLVGAGLGILTANLVLFTLGSKDNDQPVNQSVTKAAGTSPLLKPSPELTKGNPKAICPCGSGKSFDLCHGYGRWKD